MVVPASAELSEPLAVLVRRYCLSEAGLVATGVEKLQAVPSSQKRVSARAPAAKGTPPTVTTVLAPVSEPMPDWSKLTFHWVLYVPVTVTELPTVIGLTGEGAGAVSAYRLLVPAGTGLEYVYVTTAPEVSVSVL